MRKSRLTRWLVLYYFQLTGVIILLVYIYMRLYMSVFVVVKMLFFIYLLFPDSCLLVPLQVIA